MSRDITSDIEEVMALLPQRAMTIKEFQPHTPYCVTKLYEDARAGRLKANKNANGTATVTPRNGAEYLVGSDYYKDELRAAKAREQHARRREAAA